ncbi:MAG: right-handed parallel beta-helix repeat-containing protein [Acutalibacteraceae bacterium]|nr:right-handed parallel beta-helix repeat-containing protein [Acutalibacteraceae bacterium]
MARICNSDELQLLINSTPDGEICYLEEKEYYLTKQVVIQNKKGITVDGSKALIVSKYVNNDYYKKSVNPFLIKGCENVTLSNITMDTDVPCNITAMVEKIDFDEKSVVLKVDDSYQINGDEILMAFNSMDSEGSADYHMGYYAKHPDSSIVTLILGEILLANTYWTAKYDYLGNNVFKVYFPSLNEKLSVGEKICIRHTMYGPSAITLSDSDDTVLKNITMYATAGMGIVVLPKCRNLTVDGLKMVTKDGSKCLMACNCDGIHLTGLYGNFIMKNCLFDGMGDDALNVHATAGTITEQTDTNTIRCGYCKKGPDGVLPERWCESGDLIRVYDPVSMAHTGTFRVVSFKDGILKFDELSGTYKKGDTLQNTTFTPSLLIDNCIVRNTRARGFVIQTENVEIKNCNFFGMSSEAVKAAPDFAYWYEVGPTCNFNMHNNVIEKCGFVSNSPAISVLTNHNTGDEKVKHLHKNVAVKDNIIKRGNGRVIWIMATDTVSVKGNHFEHRKEKGTAPVCFVNCTEAEEKNNIDI